MPDATVVAWCVDQRRAKVLQQTLRSCTILIMQHAIYICEALRGKIRRRKGVYDHHDQVQRGRVMIKELKTPAFVTVP